MINSCYQVLDEQILQEIKMGQTIHKRLNLLTLGFLADKRQIDEEIDNCRLSELPIK